MITNPPCSSHSQNTSSCYHVMLRCDIPSQGTRRRCQASRNRTPSVHNEASPGAAWSGGTWGLWFLVAGSFPDISVSHTCFTFSLGLCGRGWDAMNRAGSFILLTQRGILRVTCVAQGLALPLDARQLPGCFLPSYSFRGGSV